MTNSQKIILGLVILALVIGGAYYVSQRSEQEQELPPIDTGIKTPEGEETSPEDNMNMKIESPTFGQEQSIPAKYTCDGQDINPPLKISDAPKNAESLVLIVDDPDAPMGTWVHWTVWNISPTTTEITENSVPEGAVEGTTNFDEPGYGGPCPPSGSHRYFFKLYALDITLELDSSAKAKDIEQTMQDHILTQAQLIGLYQH